MSKDKKRNIDEIEKKETLFYYEIIGIIIIILSLVMLLQLGTIGYWLYVLFKVLFGDYYFIILFFILYVGFYSLFMHQGFNIKNQRFIGFVFIGLGIMMFCHIPIHNYVIEKGGNYFSSTWSIYYSYLTIGIGDVLGGGLVGALIFYIFYILFGLVGVCLIAVLIIMLGISLIINRSIGDMFKYSCLHFKDIFKYTKSFSNFFKYEIGKKKEYEKTSIYNKNIQIPLKLLEDYKNEINYNFQVKLSNETKSLINSILNNMNLQYKEIETVVSYKVTTYRYLVFTDFDNRELLKKLKNVVDEEIQFGRDNRKVVIQINNKHQQFLCLRTLLFKQTNLMNNFIIPIAIDYNNRLFEFDLSSNGGLLLISDETKEIYNFLLTFIFSLFVKNNLKTFEIHLFDGDCEYANLYEFCLLEKITDINDYIQLIKNEVDKRLELLQKFNVNNIDEYNLKIEMEELQKEKIKRIVYIFKTNINDDLVLLEDKIFYIVQSAVKCGIFIIQICESHKVSNIINSIYDYKLIYKVNNHNFIYPNCYGLGTDGDGIIVKNNKELRIASSIVTANDISEIKKYIK